MTPVCVFRTFHALAGVAPLPPLGVGQNIDDQRRKFMSVEPRQLLTTLPGENK